MVIMHLSSTLTNPNGSYNYGTCGQFANGVENANGVTHATTVNLDSVDCADCVGIVCD